VEGFRRIMVDAVVLSMLSHRMRSADGLVVDLGA